MTNLINTDTLLAQMKEYHEKRAKEANMTGNRTVCVTWDDAVTLIKSAPTVDAMPVRHAKWVYKGKFYYSDNNTHNTWSCSGCGCSEFTLTRFCPNCGAKMDEE